MAYTTAHCKDPKKYKAYFGKTLDNGYATGFLADAAVSDQTNKIDQEKIVQAEKILMAMTEQQRKTLAEDIEAADVLPFLSKHEMWVNGILSPRIRSEVTNFVMRQEVTA